MEFKKLRFSEEDKREMAAFLKEFENIDLEKKEMAEIFAGDGCGGICKYSCSTFCEWNCDRNCTETCQGRCTDFVYHAGECDFCAYYYSL